MTGQAVLARCLQFRGFQCIEAYGDTWDFWTVCLIATVRCWGVSVERSSTVLTLFLWFFTAWNNCTTHFLRLFRSSSCVKGWESSRIWYTRTPSLWDTGQHLMRQQRPCVINCWSWIAGLPILLLIKLPTHSWKHRVPSTTLSKLPQLLISNGPLLHL